MTTQADKAREFLALHRAGQPLLLPNPWDLGSAKMLASLGFKALATTSSGFAASLGRLDGSVSREEALVHAAVMVAATDLPVSADLENAFADEPAGVAETIRLAIEVGLAAGDAQARCLKCGGVRLDAGARLGERRLMCVGALQAGQLFILKPLDLCLRKRDLVLDGLGLRVARDGVLLGAHASSLLAMCFDFAFKPCAQRLFAAERGTGFGGVALRLG